MKFTPLLLPLEETASGVESGINENNGKEGGDVLNAHITGQGKGKMERKKGWLINRRFPPPLEISTSYTSSLESFTSFFPPFSPSEEIKIRQIKSNQIKWKPTLFLPRNKFESIIPRLIFNPKILARVGSAERQGARRSRGWHMACDIRGMRQRERKGKVLCE